MIAFALALVAGLAVDFGLVRLMMFSRTAWPPWVFVLIFYVVWLGVPCGQYPLVELFAPAAPAVAALIVLLIAGPVMVFSLIRRNGSRWDRFQRRKAALARDRLWLTLESGHRSQVRRLARQGQVHPDPVVEAVVRQWAAETVESNYGQYLRLAKRITAAEAATRLISGEAHAS